MFGMVSRLPDNLLHHHACNIFIFTTTSSKSWMHTNCDLCLMYSLPHTSILPSTPPSKEKFKNLVKKHVTDYWEQALRAEASPLSSLEFFQPEFMSLSTPHPLWTTAASSPTKTVMATVQGRLLSGRYWTEALCSYWSNSIGLCKLSPICNVVEDMLFFCSSLPEVIRLVQKHGNHVLEHRFNITHLWCYCLHRDRLKILWRWKDFMKAYKFFSVSRHSLFCEGTLAKISIVIFLN